MYFGGYSTYNTLQIIFNGYYNRGRIWANNILNPKLIQ